MADRTQPRWIERVRSLLRAGLFLLVAGAPLPFGAVQPLSVLTIELWSAALACLAVPLLVFERRGVPRGAIAFALMAGAIIGVGSIQLIPRSPDDAWLVPAALDAARQSIWHVLPEAKPAIVPATLDGPSTVDALLRFSAYCGVGVAAYAAIRRREHLVAVVTLVALVGAAQALYGIAEYITGHQHIFGYAKTYFNDEASGTFINRNHFAGFLTACLPPTFALALAGRRDRDPQRSWRSRLVALSRSHNARRLVGAAAGVTIWLGIVCSYSRAGMATALFGTSMLAWFLVRDRRRLAALSALLLVPTAALLALEIRAPGERFVTGGAELATIHGRLPVWHGAARMAVDFMPLGSGLGTFEISYPLYRTPDVTARWDHAHNDWLQVFVEGGPVAGLAAFGMLIAFLTTAAAIRRASEPRRTLAAGLLCGGIATAANACVDFPVRIPAIAVLLAFLVGATFAATVIDGDRPG